jgi:hypothetical protein
MKYFKNHKKIDINEYKEYLLWNIISWLTDS